jgi:uncharacterized membrane protein
MLGNNGLSKGFPNVKLITQFAQFTNTRSALTNVYMNLLLTTYGGGAMLSQLKRWHHASGRV